MGTRSGELIDLRNLNLWRVLERSSGVLSRWGFRGLKGIAGRRRQRPPGSASVVEPSGDAVTSGSLEGIITGWNPGAERLYGYTLRRRPWAVLSGRL